MTTKKYQIFVSSTYTDLVQERQEAIKMILDLNHIPAGMEAFAASDIDQFDYVKRVIDECDYYLLIVAGRYGSIDPKIGISYTEREFDYAAATKKHIIAAIHDNISGIPSGHVENDKEGKEKLAAFVAKVKTGRMVKFWQTRDRLAISVMQGINHAIQYHPAVGWIRGDQTASSDVMEQFVKLSADIDELKIENERLRNQSQPQVEGLADLTDVYDIKYTCKSDRANDYKTYQLTLQITWRELLMIVGPKLYSPQAPHAINASLNGFLSDNYKHYHSFSIDNIDLNRVKIQFEALGFFNVYAAESSGGGVGEYIQLTDMGRAQLMRAMAITKNMGAQGY